MEKIFSRLSGKFFILIMLVVSLPLFLMYAYLQNMYEQTLKDELIERTTTAVYQTEQTINKTFESIEKYAGLFCTNIILNESLAQTSNYDDPLEHYNKLKIFDSIVQDVGLNNIFDIANMQVTLIDENYRFYSNWALNFNDYSFLLQEKVVIESIGDISYISWDLLTLPFIYEDETENHYVSLTRTIRNHINNEYLGTLIVSLRESEFENILDSFRLSPNDVVLVTQKGETLYGKIPEFISLNELEKIPVQVYCDDIKTGDFVTIGDTDYLVCTYQASPLPHSSETMQIIYLTNYEEIQDEFLILQHSSNALLIIGVFFSIIVVAAISFIVVKPIKKLAVTLKNYDVETKYEFVEVKSKNEIGDLQRSFYDMDKSSKNLFNNLKREQKLAEEYKLNSLRAQLSPHFLFNTLTTIRWMALIQKNTNIVESIDALANMLSYSLRQKDQTVTIEDEFKNIESYITIQNYRYGNNYTVTADISEEIKKLKIIRFVLQPIVENSVIHGFGEQQKDGNIIIKGEILNRHLRLTIADDGKGMPFETVKRLNKTSSELDEGISYKHIGISNIKQQIFIEYSAKATVEFFSELDKGTTCIIMLPIDNVSDDKVGDKD